MISSKKKTKEKQNTKDKQREVRKINPEGHKSRKTRVAAVSNDMLPLTYKKIY